MKQKFSLIFIFLALLGIGTEALAQVPVMAPTTSARYINFTGVTDNSISLTVLRGNGTGRIVVVSTENTWSDDDTFLQNTPITTFTDMNSNYTTSALQAGSANAKVVANLTGTQNSVTITGLTFNTSYHIKVYEYTNFNTTYAYRTANGILNPRSRTTLASVVSISALTAQVSNSLGQVTPAGSFAYLSWTNGTIDNNMTYTLTIKKRSGTEGSYVWAPIAGYNNTDIGTLADGGTEEYLAELPETGRYKAEVTGHYVANGNAYTTNTLISSEFERTADNENPPKFASISKESRSGEIDGYTVTFDKDVTNVATGVAGDLEATDFDVVASTASTTSAGQVYKVTKIDAKTYYLNIRFANRTAATDNIVIVPANNSSIYGLNGIAMDRFVYTTMDQQIATTAYKATVILDVASGTDYVYQTINEAISKSTLSTDVVRLKDGETYSENVAVNKALTITDDGSGSNATATGNWSISGALAAENLSINGLTFAPASVASITVGDVSTSGNVAIDGNTFNVDAAETAIKVDANRTTALANLNIGVTTANTFTGNAAATTDKAIYFAKNGAGTAGITNIKVQQNTFADVIGIDFKTDEDLTALLPAISLGSGNTNVNPMTSTPKYVYSGTTLAESDCLYPGIAVVNTSATVGCDATPYSSVTAAVSAATTGNNVFLGEGAYTDNITLNKDVNLVGKGKDKTEIAGLVVNYTTGTSAVAVKGMKINGGVDVQATNSALTLDNNDIIFAKDKPGINVSDKTVANAINITNNTFTKSGADGATAINFADNQFTAAVAVSGNTITSMDNAADKAVYVSSTNTIGASTAGGTLTFGTNNFGGTGGAIVFEDAVNQTNNLTAGSISLNGNTFDNTGNAVKVLDNASNTAFVGTTMPNITMASTGATLANTELYGVAWYGDIAVATTLYPSIQNAVTANAGTTLNIGAGSYIEDVNIPNGNSITDIAGYGNPILADGKVLTLNKDLTSSTGFTAPKVVLGHSDSKIDDALALVKAEGTIEIPNGISISGDATVNKAVTVTGAETSPTGEYTGTLTIKSDKVTVQNLTFETAEGGKSIIIEAGNATADKTGKVSILNNTFVNATNNFLAVEIINGSGDKKNFAGLDIYGNTFNNGTGYAVKNSLTSCGLLDKITVKNGTTVNTYSNTSTPKVSGFYWAGTLAETTEIMPDCEVSPTVTVKSVVAYTGTVANTGVAAGYINNANDKVKITITIPNDPSYVGGIITIKAGTSEPLVAVSGVTHTIAANEINTDVSIDVTKAQLGALVAEGNTIQFNANIAKMSGTNADGTAKSLKVDITAPLAADNKINSPVNGDAFNNLPQISGIFSAAQLNETPGTARGKIRIIVKKTGDTPKYFNSVTGQWQNESYENAPSLGSGTFNLLLATGALTDVSGAYEVTGIFTDFVGNTHTQSVINFTIDNTSPKLESIALGSGADGGKVILTFDEAMNNAFTDFPNQDIPNPYTVTITPNGGVAQTLAVETAVRGDAPYKAVALSFAGNAIQNMSDCSVLSVTVAGVRDIAGNVINANGTDNVKTYQEPDNTAPYVVSVVRKTPATELTNATQVIYTVTFNEPVTHYENTTATAISTSDFAVIANTASHPAAGTIASIASTDQKVFDVTVDVATSSDGGTLTVGLADAVKIRDKGCDGATYANAINQTGHDYTPETYKADRTAPVLTDVLFTAPVAVTVWNAGADHNITWAGTPTDGGGFGATAIKLEYVDGANTPIDITGASLLATNANSHTWSVPNTINSTSGKIKMTVTDAAGNSATKESDAFTIDNAKPTVSGIVFTPTALNETSTTFSVAVTFNEAMDNTVTPTITFDNTDVNTFLGIGTGTWDNEHKVYTKTYTLTAGSNTTLLATGVTAAISGAKDVAGNVMDNHTSTQAFSVDMVKPTLSNVSIESNNTNPLFAKNGDKVTVTFTSSKALDVAATTATIGGQTATVSAGTEPNTYKAEYTIPAGESSLAQGTLTFSITPVSTTGNTGVAVNSGNGSVTYDRTAPVISITAPAANANVNGTQLLTYTLTETNATETKAKIGNGTYTTFTSGSAINTINGWNAANNGDITVYLQHTDEAGNTKEVTRVFKKDMAAPTVSGIVFTPTALNETSTTFSVAVTFNEAMGTDAPTIAFSESSLTTPTATLTANGGSWSGNTYTANYTVANQGLDLTGVTATISGAKDIAGNVMDNHTSTQAFSVDMVKPTLSNVSIESNNTNPLFAKNGDKVTVTFTSSKALDVAATIATIGTQTATVSAGTEANTYKAEYTIPANEATIAEGELAFSITPVSTTGNTGTAVIAVTDQSSVTYDRTAPAISITAPAENANVNGTQLLTYTLTETNATETKAKIGNGTYTTFTSGSAINTINGWNPSNNGDITVYLQHTDEAGNTTEVTRVFKQDMAAPTVSSVLFTPTALNETSTTFSVAVTFNEAMDNTVAPVISFNNTDVNGFLGAGNVGTWDAEHKVYTKTYTFTAGSNATLLATGVTATISGAKDVAGNVMDNHTSTETFSVDMVKPTLSNVSITSNNTTNALFAKNGDKVTVTFTSSKALDVAATTATIGGQTATVSNVSGLQYKAEYTIPTDESSLAQGTLTFSITPKSTTGNTGTAVIAVTDQSSVTYDRTAPVISITAPAANANVNGTQLLTYTLTETNATETKAKIGNGTYTTFTSGSAINTINGWNAANNGDITVYLQHTDEAGNTTEVTRVFKKDMAAPTVIITRVAPTVGSSAEFYTNANSVQFKIKFNEAVTGFDYSKITVNTTGVTNTAISAGSLTGPTAENEYTLTVDGVTGNGDLGITVGTTGIADVAGNAMTQTENLASAKFTIDQTAPTITKVEVNCENSPIANQGMNSAVQITFSEGVYTNNTAAGALANADLSITKLPATGTALTSWALLNPTEGATHVNATLEWGGFTTGLEQVVANVASNAVFDKAGNAVTVVATPENVAANYGFTKSTISITSNPANAEVCVNGSAVFNVNATAGAGITLTWKEDKNDGAGFTAITPNTQYVVTNGGLRLTVNNVTSAMSGYKYKLVATGGCSSNPESGVATLTVKPDLVITNDNTTAIVCQADLSQSFSVTATGSGTIAYQWQYSVDGNTWNNVADGTPTNAKYTGATTATLNIANNGANNWIAAGTHQYRVAVTDGCATKYAAKTLTVNASPAMLTVNTDADICEGTVPQFTVVNAASGVTYNLKVGETQVATGTGEGSDLTLAPSVAPDLVGNANTTINYSVYAVNTNCTVKLADKAVTIHPKVIVNAGADQTICSSDNTITLHGTISGGATTGIWSVTGNGITNPTTIDGATYTIPTNIATSGGTITFTLTSADPEGPCGEVFDDVIYTVKPVAVVSITNTSTSAVCASLGGTITLNGTVTGGAATGTWSTTNGAGTITNANNLTGAVYTLAAGDLGKSSLTFRLTSGDPEAPCTATFAEHTVTINALPAKPQVAVANNPYCNGAEGATVTLTKETDITYTLWNGGSEVTSNPFANGTTATLTVGTYTVKAVNANNCSIVSDDIVITEKPALTPGTLVAGTYCASDNVAIVITGTGDGYSYQVYRDANTAVGTPVSSAGGMLNIPVSNPVSGIYTVKATYDGCTVTMSGNVVVGVTPTAPTLTQDQATQTFCSSANPTIASLAKPSEANTTYRWYHNNAIVSSSTALVTGTYQLTAQAQGGCQSEKATVNVTVNPALTGTLAVAATNNVTTFCGTAATTLTASGVTNAATYQWSDDNSFTNTLQNTTSNTYQVSGVNQNKTYYVRAVNGCGTGTAASIALTVNPAISGTLAVASGAGTTFCGTASTTLTASGVTNATSYVWSNDANFTTTISGATGATYAVTGLTESKTYYVKATDDCGTARTASITLTVNPRPEAPTIAQTTQIFCASAPHTVANLQPTNSNIHWFRNLTGGTEIGLDDGPLSSGTYYAEAFVNGCSSATRTAVTVEITDAITPSVSVATNPSGAICAGASVTFTATPSDVGGGTVAYQWKKNGNNVGTNQATYTDATLVNNDAITAEITITGASCLASNTAISSSVNVTVNPLPTAPSTLAAANNVTTFCGTGATTLTASGATNATSYEWSDNANFNPIISNATGATYAVTGLQSSKTYYVKAVNDCGKSTSQSITLTVNPLPTAPTAAATQQFCSANANTVANLVPAPSTTVKWYAAATGGTDLANNTVLTNNTYYAESVAGTGCVSATRTAVTVQITSAVTPSVSVAANPSGAICAGASVTFTATPSNVSGGTVAYQWKKNGSNVGTNQATYTDATLTSNDNITAEITITGGSCLSSNTATSSSVNVTVNPLPSVTITGGESGVEVNTDVTLTATQVQGYTYSWTATGGTITGGNTGNTLQVKWATSGAKSVSLLVTSNGCTKEFTRNVNVNDPTPTAPTFASHPQNAAVCVNSPATFAASATGTTSITYQWQARQNAQATSWIDLADNTMYNGVTTNTLTVTPDVIGLNGYQYRLKATNSVAPNGVFSNVATLTVNPLPTAPSTLAAANNVTTFCGVANTTLTANSIAGATYQWSTDNFVSTISGQTSNTLSVSNLATTTTYKVRTTNGCGQSTSQSITLTVNPLPTAPQAAATQQFCSANANTVANLVPAPSTTVKWYAAATGGNELVGTTVLQNNVKYYAEAVAGTGCVSATRTEVTVQITSVVTPSVSVAANPSGAICAGASVTFTATPSNVGGGTVAYQWKKNGSNVGTNQATYTDANLTSNDNITAEINISGGSCLASNTATSSAVNVTVNPLPSVTISGGESGVEVNTNVTLTATQVQGYTYSWTATGGTITGGNTVNTLQVKWATSGAKSVSLLVTSNGCTNTFTHNVTVNAPAAVAPTIATQPVGVEVCVNSNATFTASATGTTPITYQWQVKIGAADWTDIAGQTTGTLTLNNVTSTMNGNQYRLKATNSAGSIESNPATLTVNSAPTTVSISTENNITVLPTNGNGLILTANVTGGTGTLTYDWYKDNILLSNATQSTMTASDPGSYKVTVSNNCGSVTSVAVNITNVQLTAVTGFQATAKTSNSVTIAWDNAANNPVIVVAKAASNYDIIDYSSPLVLPLANTNFANAPIITGSSKLVYNGNASLITITGLTNYTRYTFAIYKYILNSNGQVIQLSPVTYLTTRTLYKQSEGNDAVNTLEAGTFSVCRVMPNPVKNEINYCIDSYEDDTYTVELANEAGAVMIRANLSLKAGQSPLTLNLNSQNGVLSAGAYFLTIRNRFDALTQKVIVLP